MPAPLERILFIAASSLTDPEDRRILIDRVCGGDAQLKKSVEGIFALQTAAADFFEGEPEISASGSGDDEEAGLGSRIGRFRLIERLGEGGWGVVYLAEQVEPVRRKVALKIIRLGMDTEKVIARFGQERQALAMMDHPNIARVLDAGATSSGRPYFAMELVDGERITAFCDEHRLSIRDRLEIFIRVCHAIQHAHQKGIIHRDIKPSNILVRLHDGVPVPKVIDFGIAKAASRTADDDVTLTALDQLVGTPAYMSPEIAAGAPDLDTRTDIHSLGATLYELLAGQPPFDPARLQTLGMPGIRDLLQTEDPPVPSQALAALGSGELARVAALRSTDASKLKSEVKGDLDWIVTKALERDRTRRYHTAHGLASDLERYLRNQPVSAGPPDRLYLLSKLVRRHKATVLFSSFIVLSLGVGFGTSTWLWLREKDARNEQERLKIEANVARENESTLKKRAEARGLLSLAAVRVYYGDLDGADKLLREIPVELAPISLEAARSYSAVGDWHVVSGRWEEATDCFASAALALTTVDTSDSDAVSIAFLPAAATLAQAGDRQRYESIRNAAIQRFRVTSNPVVAEQVIKSALLLPPAPSTLAELKPLAVMLEEDLRNDGPLLTRNPHRIAWCEFALALYYYRHGDFAASLSHATRCISNQGANASRDASVKVLLAMIYGRLGQPESARTFLDEAGAAVAAHFEKPVAIGGTSSFWFDWVNARILVREAHTLLDR